jgi:hypothetical protein
MSNLPFERMAMDATNAIKTYERFPGGTSFAADLGCHVLALLEERDRMKASQARLLKAAESVLLDYESPERTWGAHMHELKLAVAEYEAGL